MCRACVRPTKKCECCGLLFKYSPSQKRRYCSVLCYASHDKTTGKRKRTRGWKGSGVSYRQLHQWLYLEKGRPITCVDCNKVALTGRQIHWANISGEYKRDTNDYKALCVSCHNIYDEKYKNLPQQPQIRDKSGRFTGVFVSQSNQK